MRGTEAGDPVLSMEVNGPGDTKGPPSFLEFYRDLMEGILFIDNIATDPSIGGMHSELRTEE